MAFQHPRLGAAEARRAVRSPNAIWSMALSSGRLEPECWPVIEPKFRIGRDDTVFTIGSCFARNIEEYLARLGLKVPMSAFEWHCDNGERLGPGGLNKFTPHDILQEVERTSRLLDATESEREAIFREPLLDLRDGRYIDLDVLGAGPMPIESAMAFRRAVFEAFRWAFDGDVVIITAGHIESWWDGVTGLAVQRLPTAAIGGLRERFYTRRLTFAETYEALERTIQVLNKRGEKKILLTTSPVPLSATFSGEDILLANTFSKSILRAAIGELVAAYPSVGYFPSYESAMLTRVAGVWEADRRHVSDGFVGKIVQRFIEVYVEGQALPSDTVGNIWTHLRVARPGAALAALEAAPPADPATADTLRGLALVAQGDSGGLDLLTSSVATAEIASDMRLAAALELFYAERYAEAAAVAKSNEEDEIENGQVRRTLKAVGPLADAATGQADLDDVIGKVGNREGRSRAMVAQLSAMLLFRKGEVARAQGELQFERKKNQTLVAGQTLHARALAATAQIEAAAGNRDTARKMLQEAAENAPEDRAIAAQVAAFERGERVPGWFEIPERVLVL